VTASVNSINGSLSVMKEFFVSCAIGSEFCLTIQAKIPPNFVRQTDG